MCLSAARCGTHSSAPSPSPPKKSMQKYAVTAYAKKKSLPLSMTVRIPHGDEVIELHVPSYVSRRVQVNRWGCREMNRLLDTDAFDLMHAVRRGSVKVTVDGDVADQLWIALVFVEFANFARQKEGPRFACGALGSAFVDVMLTTGPTRVYLDAGSVVSQGVWYIKPISL